MGFTAELPRSQRKREGWKRVLEWELLNPESSRGGGPHPLFFVSAESKGLSDPVSSLDAILTGVFVSIDSTQVSMQGRRVIGHGKRWDEGRVARVRN